LIIPQAEIDEIQNSKVKRRILYIPVKYSRGRATPVHPKTGRRLAVARQAKLTTEVPSRCPCRKGGVYNLTPPPPLDRYREQAARQPSHARAVLWFIDRCGRQPKPVKIPVTQTPRTQLVDGTLVWVVRFEPGDRRELFDRSVYLSKVGDYTMTASTQAVPGDPELMSPLAEDIAKARLKALERRVSPEREVITQAKGALSPLQRSMSEMRCRTRLARVLKELEKIEAELSVHDDAILPVSARATRPVSAAVEGEPRPCGTDSLVSLESAPTREAA
jgi:hypothetical protein